MWIGSCLPTIRSEQRSRHFRDKAVIRPGGREILSQKGSILHRLVLPLS
jgi:hypothetical protein